jgi:hypothetical protein
LAKGSRNKKGIIGKRPNTPMELGTRQTLLNKDIGNKKMYTVLIIRKKMAC